MNTTFLVLVSYFKGEELARNEYEELENSHSPSMFLSINNEGLTILLNGAR